MPKSYAKFTLQNSFSGINGQILKNVSATLDNKQKSLSPLDEKKILKFYQETPQEITNAIQPFGYFKATIKSSLTNKNSAYHAHYVITLNEPLKITSTDIQITGAGAEEKFLNFLLKKTKLKTGNTLVIANYQEAKNDLLEAALNLGYLEANLEKSAVYINLKKYTVEVVLHFNTGERYKFGNVVFNCPKLSEKFLRRFINFKEGDFYSAKVILELQNNLINSNLFEQVSINPDLTQAKNNVVPINIDLKLRKNRQFNIGLGFGTDTGIRALLGMELRRINDKGQSFKTLFKASSVEANLEAHYLMPGKNPVTDQYDISANLAAQNQSYGNSSAAQIGVSYITNIWQKWQQTIGIIAHAENYQLENEPPKNAFLLLPTINWLHSSANDVIRPTRGHRVNINLQGASKKFASSINFAQAKIDLKYIIPILSSKNLAVVRATAGTTSISDVNNLPLTLQYFVGGTQTLRGYDFNGIGPDKTMLVGSLELRRQIIEDWYVAAFYDVGNVANSFRMKLNRGAGVGIVWLSPIGAMEITAARGLDLPNKPIKIQFNMGPEL